MGFPNRPLLLLLLGVAAIAAAGDFVAPAVNPAKTYPAHDFHAREGVTVAADPYVTAQQNATFRNAYLEHGFLPVFVVITNDNSLPLALTGMKLELDFGYHTRIKPASSEELLRRMTQPSRPGPRPIPLPIPLPRHKDSRSQKLAEEFETAHFQALAVEPQLSRGGFFFFDVSGISTPLAKASLVVSHIRDGNGNELFYFEVPLAPALAGASIAAPAAQ